MLKRSRDGLYVISSHKEAAEALSQVEELSQTVVEIEKRVEEDYGLSTMRTEATDLTKAVHQFMVAKNVDEIERPDAGYRLKIVRRYKRSWNADKLKRFVDKATWLKITDQTPNPVKIDDLVRQGKLDMTHIEAAFEERPEQPHVRRYAISEGADEEAEKVAEAFS